MQKELQETKNQLDDQRALAQHQADASEQLKKESDELAEAKKQLADQRQLMQRQANAENQLKQEAEEAKKQIQDNQRQLEAHQASTKEEFHWVENVLGGIILPPNTDPKSWMMRVAAVPVQQQQFCRIVDQFHDKLGSVYQTHNEIKKNALFRDRKIEMATLLPQGNFENWVVQIKEVTQAPDGSAAVMLQPPCRAMLGSDACQKNGSKIRATIPVDSPLYRELSKVSAGDFVVISGKILYAQSADPNQPLPTYAVYQAGSHCSAISESKQEDVFVTEINYLVQLR
jgi:hypothetical protein